FQDGVKVIKAHPSIYVMGLGLSNRLFFSPNHINPFYLQHNRGAAWAVHRWTMPVIYGVPLGVEFVRVPRFGWKNGPDVPIWTSVPLMIEWVLFLSYGYVQARKSLRATDRSEQARAIVLG